jgi:UTP--glucose-1-phosphate uridylyltransferase
MQITKGVIAAAGRGTRFLPTTKAYPKELIPILGKPNIQYLVEEMIGAEIKEIAIIHRPGETKIKEYFSPDQNLKKYLKKNNKLDYLESLERIWQKATLEFIPQSPELPYGNASPVLAAKKFINNQPFIYMFGDDFILEDNPGNYLGLLIKVFKNHQPEVVLGCQKVPWEEINRYGSVQYAEKPDVPNQAVAVLEKLPKDKAPSNIAQFGRFIFSPKIFPVLKDQETSKSELWLSDANNTLAKNNIAIAEPIQQGKWLTTGDPLRWLKTNIEVGLNNPHFQADLKAYLAEIDRS